MSCATRGDVESKNAAGHQKKDDKIGSFKLNDYSNGENQKCRKNQQTDPGANKCITI